MSRHHKDTMKKLPPILEYKLPPKYPFTGEVAAYTKIAVLSIDPRLNR